MITGVVKLGLAIGILSMIACGGSGEPDAVLVTFETPEGSFTARIEDPASIQRVQQALESDGRAGIPNGVIVEGSGGVNPGHDWHLEDVEMVDMTIEVCDGTADYVDAHLEDFLALGQFCPWSAVVVDVQPDR
ncbi:MAG: hypothetical protein ACRDWH_05505 [Acidimicrobiia bacterium]